jgi:hypothetical protein
MLKNGSSPFLREEKWTPRLLGILLCGTRKGAVKIDLLFCVKFSSSLVLHCSHVNALRLTVPLYKITYTTQNKI